MCAQSAAPIPKFLAATGYQFLEQMLYHKPWFGVHSESMKIEETSNKCAGEWK